MRLTFSAIAGLGLSLPGLAAADPVTYDIDPEHVSIGFLAGHLGYASVLGFFGEVEGSFSFDAETGEISAVSVAVATASVFSNHEARDDHLRGGDFLDSRRHPVMRFSEVTAEQLSPSEFVLTGQLELLGETRPLVLQATWNKTAPYPIGRSVNVIGVSARGSVRRSEFGMTYAVDNGWVADEVEIIIEFEARAR